MVELISSRKTVPVWAASKRPVRLADRAGERPADVPEQFALQQVLGQRAAIDADERAAAPRAEPVNRLGDQLLARARLAQQQHRGVRAGHLPGQPIDVLHRRPGADQARDRRPGFVQINVRRMPDISRG